MTVKMRYLENKLFTKESIEVKSLNYTEVINELAIHNPQKTTVQMIYLKMYTNLLIKKSTKSLWRLKIVVFEDKSLHCNQCEFKCLKFTALHKLRVLKHK